jgi:hypothetical protein
VKEIFALVAIAVSCGAFGHYIWQIARGALRPHAISWLTWGIATAAVFGAQLISGAGIGAWPTAVLAAGTFSVLGLTLWRCGFDRAAPIDWAFFVAALGGLALWFWTREPLAAVAIMTGIDVIGNGPTIRKAFRDPFADSPVFFVLMGVSNAVGLAALETYSVTTVLFPLVVGTACTLVGVLMLARRRLASAG